MNARPTVSVRYADNSATIRFTAPPLLNVPSTPAMNRPRRPRQAPSVETTDSLLDSARTYLERAAFNERALGNEGRGLRILGIADAVINEAGVQQ